MKESGLNYFFQEQGLLPSSWGILYTFETGAGLVINNVSGGAPQYSGILSNNSSFWQKPGSGYFSGTSVAIQNASGLYSNGWTMIFVYEKTTNNGGILFSNLNGTSGFQVGLTDTNKPYFQSNNNGQIIGTSLNNYGSKNAIVLGYLPNYLSISNFNFTSQSLETESFNSFFNVTESDNWKLGPSWTGYMDYFMYFNQYYSANVLNTFLSGLYNYPTGTGFNITTVCSSGVVTGFQNIIIYNTGITGYTVTYDTGAGFSDYTGVFPTGGVATPLTGIINTGLYVSGVTGTVCFPLTGASTVLFQTLTGYISSFGMDKIQLESFLYNSDIVKTSVSYTPFDYNYNIQAQQQYSGFFLAPSLGINTGAEINMFLNGVAQGTNGWFLSGNYLLMTGVNGSDILFIDTKIGNQNAYIASGNVISFPFNYSGQEIFLNEVNLISGYDYTWNNTGITFTSTSTGITGYVFEYPIVLTITTGNYSQITGKRFDRSTSNVYLNGIRQGIGLDYVEGSAYDLFSGNYYNNTQGYLQFIYNDTNDFWTNF